VVVAARRDASRRSRPVFYATSFV